MQAEQPREHPMARIILPFITTGFASWTHIL
jgi:hypothetical protein